MISSQSSHPHSWWAIATRWSVVRRAIKMAIVVGAILISINHGDAILTGNVDIERLARMGLTVMVPFLVSTISSVGALMEKEKTGKK